MSNGASFIFDEADLPLIKKHTWSNARGHIRTLIDNRTVYLHRLIMGLPDEFEIDHINMDKTDNRRCNLRIATHSENQMNRGVRCDNTSGFKGVCLDKRTDKYFAYINASGKRTYLGTFDDKYHAAEAYDKAAILLHGEYARPNFMKGEIPNEQPKEILELDNAC